MPPLKPGSKTPHRPSGSSHSSSNPEKEKHHKKSPNPSPNSPSPQRPKPPPSPAPSIMSKDGPESSRKRPHNQMDDEDAITILNAVVDFRANHAGSGPTPTTMKPVYDAVKGKLHQEITFDQLYNKFRSLKHRYSKAVESGVGSTPFDRQFYDLSVRAWGEKKPKDADRVSSIKKRSSSSKKPKIEENGYGHQAAENGEEEEEEEDGAASADDAEEDEDGDGEENQDVDDSFKLLMDQGRKYWEKEGMSVSALELGLKFMDKSKAVTLEKRWRQHLEVEWKIEAKTFDAKKDFLTALSTV